MQCSGRQKDQHTHQDHAKQEFGDRFCKQILFYGIFLLLGRLPHQCAHWFAMTDRLDQNAVAMVDLVLDDLGGETLEGLKAKLHIHSMVLHFDLLIAFGWAGIT